MLKDLLRSGANLVFDFNYYRSILKKTNLAFEKKGIRSRGGRQNFMQHGHQFIYISKSETRSNALCNIPSSRSLYQRIALAFLIKEKNCHGGTYLDTGGLPYGESRLDDVLQSQLNEDNDDHRSRIN